MIEADTAHGFNEEVSFFAAFQSWDEVLRPDELDIELKALLDLLDVAKLPDVNYFSPSATITLPHRMSVAGTGAEPQSNTGFFVVLLRNCANNAVGSLRSDDLEAGKALGPGNFWIGSG